MRSSVCLSPISAPFSELVLLSTNAIEQPQAPTSALNQPPEFPITGMSTSQILQRLYSFDTASFDFLRHLYYLIQYDEKDQYLISLQGSELARLVNFLGEVRAVPSTFHQFTNRLHRPSVPSPQPMILDENA